VTPQLNEKDTTMTIRANTGARATHLRPRITLTPTDHKLLSGLANAAEVTMPDEAALLAQEVDRAHVLAKGRQPVDLVCMGSETTFEDDSGRVQRVTLVYPKDADISEGKISVLTPIGAALIGLKIGQTITWETRTGEIKRLTVREVRQPQLA